MAPPADRLRQSLLRIFDRAPEPIAWSHGGDYPWHDRAFGRRALADHLDETHAGGSRPLRERRLQVDWLWRQLEIEAGQRVLDAGCGPGLYCTELARRGLSVLGLDLSEASIDHARELADARGVASCCELRVADYRTASLVPDFTAALLLYGQLGPLRPPEAKSLLRRLVACLRPGGRLVFDALDPARVERSDDSWWFSGEADVWSDGPYLHLGERFWNEERKFSVERTLVLHLDTGEIDEYESCDQSWEPAEIEEILLEAGCSEVEVFPGWDGLDLGDAEDWIVYLARR